MKENLLPKTTCLLWQIRVLVAGIILSAAAAFLCFISIWFILLPTVFMTAVAISIFWYLPAYFASYEIQFPSGAIIINRGVFIKTSHIMPFSRLVYAQSVSTPLAKAMGLSAVILKAARSSLLIPEVYEKDVNDFIKSLTREVET